MTSVNAELYHREQEPDFFARECTDCGRKAGRGHEESCRYASCECEHPRLLHETPGMECCIVGCGCPTFRNAE